MGNNQKVTDYITEKPEFTQEIMIQLRTIIHQAAPELSETIKWRQPCFEQDGLVCAFAAFKKHVNFAFFKGKLIDDSAALFEPSDNNELTSLKLTCLADIPNEVVLINYIQQAVALNKQKDKKPKTSVKKVKTELIVPDDLAKALKNEPLANDVFTAFSYSKQKDYIEWLTSAKREATREKRLVTALEWIGEGKSRHWKYEKW